MDSEKIERYINLLLAQQMTMETALLVLFATHPDKATAHRWFKALCEKTDDSVLSFPLSDVALTYAERSRERLLAMLQPSPDEP